MRFSGEGRERRLIGDLVLCGKLEINENKVYKRSLKGGRDIMGWS